MESSPFLPRCPKCSAWPMAFASVDEAFHDRVRFVCGRCATVSEATIRRRSIQRQSENVLAT